MANKKARELSRRRIAAHVKQAAKRENKRQKKLQRRRLDGGIQLAPRIKMKIESTVYAESVFADLERR